MTNQTRAPAEATSASPSRRRFLGLLAAAALAPLAARDAYAGTKLQLEHPAPRPGIDGSKVLRAADLADAPHVVRLFDQVREIPHIADGIRCYCGCAQVEGYRSLLSCYEAPGMARYCEICQGQARLAAGRAREGQTLEQIRRAIDARYGHGDPRVGRAAAPHEHCHG